MKKFLVRFALLVGLAIAILNCVGIALYMPILSIIARAKARKIACENAPISEEYGDIIKWLNPINPIKCVARYMESMIGIWKFWKQKLSV